MAASKIRFYLYDNAQRRFFEIHDGFLCGRVEGDLQFPDDTVVSRRQCQLHVSGNDVYVEDLHSTNRTKVNNAPIQPGFKRRIQINDVIEFGSQRLVLSHQDKFSPANIQDSRDPVYRAARTEGGRLTSEVSQLLTQRTMLMLDKASFRKLKIGEALGAGRRSGRRESDRTHDRQATYAARSLLLALGLLWLAQLGALGAGGALEGGLPNHATEIGLGATLVWVASAALGLLVFTRVVLAIAKSRAGRWLGTLLIVVLVLVVDLVLASKSGLASRTAQNLAARHCLQAWEESVCRPLALLERGDWVYFSAEMRVRLQNGIKAAP